MERQLKFDFKKPKSKDALYDTWAAMIKKCLPVINIYRSLESTKTDDIIVVLPSSEIRLTIDYSKFTGNERDNLTRMKKSVTYSAREWYADHIDTQLKAFKL